MAGFYGALRIQHAEWKLSPRAAGAEMVFSQIRLVADAVFYFLRWRVRHSRQLRDRSSRPSGIARLHPTASTKRCHPIRPGQRTYARDEYCRHRASADGLRRKMAAAILTTVFVKKPRQCPLLGKIGPSLSASSSWWSLLCDCWPAIARANAAKNATAKTDAKASAASPAAFPSGCPIQTSATGNVTIVSARQTIITRPRITSTF